MTFPLLDLSLIKDLKHCPPFAPHPLAKCHSENMLQALNKSLGRRLACSTDWHSPPVRPADRSKFQPYEFHKNVHEPKTDIIEADLHQRSQKFGAGSAVRMELQRGFAVSRWRFFQTQPIVLWDDPSPTTAAGFGRANHCPTAPFRGNLGALLSIGRV